MDFNQIENIDADSLEFDTRNPRLVEFGFTKKTPQKEIIETLWEEMAIDEIIMSIKASGFFKNEPLIAVKEDNKFVVIEGNRRLTAVKAIRHPSTFNDKRLSALVAGVTKKIKDQLEKLPVILINSRKDAWRYIGFKHVNGPVKWGSYAKAQYIAQVHNDFKVSLAEISSQIGDTHLTVQKMYQGLMVIEQAENKTNFNRNDITTPRLFFSHLYTGLQLDGFKQFLGLKEFSEENKSPVPEKNLKNLEQLMFWLFGSKKLKQKQLIKSQNPDLRLLSDTLQKKDAIAILSSTNDLQLAYEASQDSSEVLYQKLIDARVALQKAQSLITTGYNGEDYVYEEAQTVASLSEDIVWTLRSKRNPEKPRLIGRIDLNDV
jgi:hypothetical protein